MSQLTQLREYVNLLIGLYDEHTSIWLRHMGAYIPNYGKLASAVRNVNGSVDDYDPNGVDYYFEYSNNLDDTLKGVYADALLESA